MEALAELFAEDVVWHTQAATRSQASLRDALPPLRHWPKSSSFRTARMPWNSTTSWLTTITGGALLRCTAQRDGNELRAGFHTAAARSPRFEDWGATREHPTNSGRTSISPDTSRSDPDRYDPGLLDVTLWEVSSRVRDACPNSSRASVRSRLPSVAGELVTTRWDGPTVDDPRSAGTRVMSASRRSSRIPSRRTSTDALMTTGETPCSPLWLVAELLQLWAVLGQSGRRALRRRQ
jgi:hypothetical protein